MRIYQRPNIVIDIHRTANELHARASETFTRRFSRKCFFFNAHACLNFNRYRIRNTRDFFYAFFFFFREKNKNPVRIIYARTLRILALDSRDTN